jgi:two-component system, sensor histidine kinase and response regulator
MLGTQHETSEEAPSARPAASPPRLRTLFALLTQRRHRIVAACVGLFQLTVVAVALPAARQPWLRLDAFIPIFSTLIFGASLITAVVLLSQWSITQRRSMLVLAGTYLFSAFMAIPYLVSFPGAFAPQGGWGATSQTTNWLWIFWHAGFPLGVGLYLWSRRRDGRAAGPQRARWRGVALAGLGGLAGVVGFSLIAFRLAPWLPTLIVNGNFERVVGSGIGPLLGAISGGVFLAILISTRGDTHTHLWLSLALLAWMCDITLNLASGTRFSVGWYVSRLNMLVAAFTVLCGLIYEITYLYHQLAAKESDLQEALQVRDEFLQLAAHELRSPVTVISGTLQMLQRGLSRPEVPTARHLQRTEVMLQQISRLTTLINRLLDISRIQAGRLSIERAPINLLAAVRHVIEGLNAGVQLHRISLEAAADEVLILGDVVRLEQVFYNLFYNAIKYSPQGGEIVCRIQRAGALVCCEIQDQGIGIAPQEYERIFERFYRVSQSAASDISGFGIGLAVVKEIVDLHGGTITVESQPGQGSTFKVYLPIYAAADLEAAK